MLTKCDAEAIRATRERGLGAFNAGDVNEFMEVWPADDIVVMVPNAPPVVGKRALQVFLEQAFAAAKIEEELSAQEQVISGDWAFERLVLSETIVPRSGAPTIRLQGKGIDLYRRQPDGSWKVARSILNYDA